jgi:hypothetical protein
MRTCWTCGHWQPANPREKIHGECCCDVPYWAFEETGAPARRFVRATDPGAAECDCYVARKREEKTVMATFKVRATASVDLEFQVEAGDEDEANEKAAAMAKRIRSDARGSVDLPRDAIMAWPTADMLEWYETYQED